MISLLLSCKTKDAEKGANKKEEEDKPIEFNVPEGFVLEDLYKPSAANRGSWVSLATGPDNHLFASDQYGHIYKFPIPEPGQTLDTNAIEKIKFPIGRANSMLWAFNSLYVVVNGRTNEDYLGSGVYRLTDSAEDDDDDLDKIEILLRLDGSGEHGPHSLILGPDQQSLFLLAGNHTKIPAEITSSKLPMNWGEDQLFPQYKDARGHAADIEAPGGWIAYTDPEGKNWELYSAGYRNPYDIAFNKNGDLFTFDADMEWDLGMPWYRPIRVCHVTSGSEYGWRTGSGKWPVYYPDNLPPVVNLGQGSPTGIFMGHELDFPSKYKNGLFVMDWSFGTIYYVDLQQKGSSYQGTSEEFFSGTPLPLTDAVVGPDGHLYFATGGRRLTSHLFRLRYKDAEQLSQAVLTSNAPNELVQLRRSLEAYHNQQDNRAINFIWQHLNHPDRFVRYASRIALEHQDIKRWSRRVFREKESEKLIQAAIALARTDNHAYTDKTIAKLVNLSFEDLETPQKLDLIRAYGLLLIRQQSNSTTNQSIINQLDGAMEHPDNEIKKEAGKLLAFLGEETVTAKLVDLLEQSTANKKVDTDTYLSDDVTDRSEQYGPAIKEMLANMPPSEAIDYALTLSHVKEGWNEDLLTRYFTWFYTVFNSKGGMSFKGFMDRVRYKALDNLPESQRKKYEELSGIFSPGEALANLPQPDGPGKEYTFQELNRAINNGLRDYHGDIEKGKLIYKAALCETCHRMRGEGGNAGPDLTQVHTRFNRWALIYSIYTPNEEISDQYAYNLYSLDNGSKLAGRLVEEKDTELKIQPNPYDPSYLITLEKSSVTQTELSPISPMPPGLLNRLNEEELADLFAYLESGGDSKHEYYTKKEN